jgi:pimeloyl-ACP methyl ester carboxylesterase
MSWRGWRPGKRWAIGGAAALLLALAAISAAGWHFSSAVLVPEHKPWYDPVEVEDVVPGRITLDRSDATLRPGYYGLVWHSGHAIVGPVIDEDTDSVTRELRGVNGYLEPGTEQIGFDSSTHSGTPAAARGLPFSEVVVEGELGPMPAWLVPGRIRPEPETWAIVVHGINDDPQVGLRILPTLRRAGLSSLSITYRDDLGAPPSPDGMHHQGLTEWRDLEAAARYALAHGARRLVLVGYSMGGALIGQLMQRSPLASRVSALVLDAPTLDWNAILEFNAERMGYPAFAALPVKWAIDVRTNPDWNSLDLLQHTEAFHLPTLLFHGTDDEVIPIETSEEFATELPRWVEYHAVPQAGHTQSWNVNPRLYEQRLERFLVKSLAVRDEVRRGSEGAEQQAIRRR